MCVVFVFVTRGCCERFSLHLNVPARSIQLKEAFRKERRVVSSEDSVKSWSFTRGRIPKRRRLLRLDRFRRVVGPNRTE